MAKRIRPADLPILTETVGDTPLELPTLTEIPEEPLSAKGLDAAQARMLAEALFPLLETKLLETLNATPDWSSAMQQVRAALPALIRQSASKPR